jgi:hypothetical protein
MKSLLSISFIGVDYSKASLPLMMLTREKKRMNFLSDQVLCHFWYFHSCFPVNTVLLGIIKIREA